MGKKRRSQLQSMRSALTHLFAPDPNHDLKKLMEDAYYCRWMGYKDEASTIMESVCRAVERRSYNPYDPDEYEEDDYSVIETFTPTKTAAKSSEEAAYEHAVINQFRDRTC